MMDREGIDALAKKTLPQFPPQNRAGHGQVEYRCSQKRHVFMVVPGEPVNEEGMRVHAEMCRRSGLPDQEVWSLGTPLPPEKCDVVLVVVALWIDKTRVGPQGPERIGGHTLPHEFARVDMKEFLAHAEASLGPELLLAGGDLPRFRGGRR